MRTVTGNNNFDRIPSATVLACVTLFLLAFCFAVYTLPLLKFRPGEFPRTQSLSLSRAPVDGEFFVSHGNNEQSHLALYHGIGPSIHYARQADILIVGNSRAQLGLSESVFTTQAQSLGLSVFNLAVGHVGRIGFALDVIRRHDLRPRLVIVNGGPPVYRDIYSPWAEEVVGMTGWQARKAYFETFAGWQLRSRLGQVMPRLEYFVEKHYRWVHYRSEQTGWYRNLQVPSQRYRVKDQAGMRKHPSSVAMARELQDELASWGGRMVLTIVPFARVNTGHLPVISEALGVSYIVPSFEGLETADGSHLAPASADIVSERIWRQLVTLPEFKAAFPELAD